MRKKTLRWAEITKKYIGVPHEFGGTSLEGLDCLTLTGKLLEEIGTQVNWDDSYKDITLKTYKELPHKKQMELLPEYLKSRSYKIEKKEMKIGDIIFFKKEGLEYVGIYTGNNKYMTSTFEKGVCTFNLQGVELLEVRRWHKQ